MHADELWQVFSENGQPIAGRGAIDDSFDQDGTLVMGNAHVWCWRKTPSGSDILLQKRALTKKHSPGYFHISAAGHINVGETAVEAAVRETQEELGIAIDPSKLYLVHVTRAARNLKSLLHVFTYQLAGDEKFSFDDGEVESVDWYDLEVFRDMTHNAASHMILDQGRPYFDPLCDTIGRLAKNL